MAKLIHSTGPVPCPYAIIAERPGKVEARIGRVLCGPSGKETDRYLAVNAGIPRHSIFASNVVRDWRNDEPPSVEEIQRDRATLEWELKEVQPHYILAMGLYAARWFLGDDIEMEWAHGLAFPIANHANVEPEDAHAWVMPCYHASAGLHQPAIAAKVAWDFEQFGKMCHGEKMPTGHLRDEYPNPDYYPEYNRKGVEVWPKGGVAGVDTEGSVEHPWCMSWSDTAGKGVVNRDGCPIGNGGLTVLHSALHDLPVLAAMGVVPECWTDTLLMAALLQTEPQGLKALARRHAGMKMQEYSDIVAGARRDKALEYLSRAVDWAVEHAETKPPETD